MSARRFARLALAATMFAGITAGAQARCNSPAEESAFDVSALKSELSVLAVQCGTDNDYNAFVERARSVLVREDGVVNGWFKKAYGRQAQPKYDAFITLQANEQSLEGQHEGSDFCPRMKPVFAEAMAVPLESLPQYAAAKNLSPVDLACTGTTVVAAPAGHSTSRTTRHRK